jgi:formylglycine-generating enzyme required for sulfatase activity
MNLKTSLNRTNIFFNFRKIMHFCKFTKHGVFWTKGNSASGTTADYTNDDETNLVLVNRNNSVGTAEVGTKTANALGIFDMNGNVIEACSLYPAIGNSKYQLGGSWEGLPFMFAGNQSLMIGYALRDIVWGTYYDTGFRFGRSQ